MGRIRGLFLSLILVFSFAPSVSFAFTNQELASFLTEEGLTEEQLSDYLFIWDSSVEDFESIEELEDFLGERITSENLPELLASYGLANEEALVSLLVENGEMEVGENVRDVFVFLDGLEMMVDLYTGTAVTDENLQQLLDDYGLTLDELKGIFIANEDSIESYEFLEDLEDMLLVYGLPVTEQTLQNLLIDYGLTLEQVNSILMANDDSLENYDSIYDLEYALLDYGMPITEQNLQELLDIYEISREQFDALLAKYDDSLVNYETIDELYFTVAMYMVLEESDEFVDDLGIGLDKGELVNLVKHFLTIDFMEPAFEEKLFDLDNRLSAFGVFDSADDLTPEQISEMISIYDEIMDLFSLDAKYYLVKGTEKIALSQQDMMEMESTNGYDLLIELYNQEGVFLADFLLTAELFGSDLIDKIDDKLDVVEDVKVTTPDKTNGGQGTTNEEVRTVIGGKLPNTAGNYGEGILAGLALVLAGAFMLRKRIVKHS